MEKSAINANLANLSYDELVDLVVRLQNENMLLKHHLFSSKKERLIAEPVGITCLFDEAEAQLENAAPFSDNDEKKDDDSEVKGHKRKRRGKRKPLPDNLPRERVVFDLPESEKFCACHGIALTKMGETVSEKLDIIPASVKVIQQVTVSYKCNCCDQEGNVEIIKSKKDPEIVSKGIATPGLIAYAATAKYEDALPLYRQQKIFERYGVKMSRASLARWMIQAAEACQPLINLMKEDLLASTVLHCDETPLQVLNEQKRSPEQKSFMWILARAYDGPLILFSYYETRSKHAGLDLLQDYNGILIAGGLKTYDALARVSEITLAACWAHARRKFFLAEKAEKKLAKGVVNLLPSQALQFIRQLYKIEREIKGKDPDTIKRIREEKSRPILESFHAWLIKQQTAIMPQSLLGKAISYTLDQWPKLLIYCTNALVAIDNNYCEAHIRPFVIGRGNWVFSATPAGAHASATIYSLIESAKANGISAYDYLRLIFKELPKAKNLEDYEKLLPHHANEHFNLKSYQIPS